MVVGFMEPTCFKMPVRVGMLTLALYTLKEPRQQILTEVIPERFIYKRITSDQKEVLVQRLAEHL